MTKQSIGKYILIDPAECPTRQELKDTIERLKKDVEILIRYKGKKNADPNCLRAAIQFLERLYLDNRLRHNVKDQGEDVKDV